MRQYLELLRQVRTSGLKKTDRTGVGTLSGAAAAVSVGAGDCAYSVDRPKTATMKIAVPISRRTGRLFCASARMVCYS